MHVGLLLKKVLPFLESNDPSPCLRKPRYPELWDLRTGAVVSDDWGWALFPKFGTLALIPQ